MREKRNTIIDFCIIVCVMVSTVSIFYILFQFYNK